MLRFITFLLLSVYYDVRFSYSLVLYLLFVIRYVFNVGKFVSFYYYVHVF